FETKLNVAVLQWTPDGKKLIFEANRGGFGLSASVMVYDLTSKQLLTLAKDGSAPSVSPDGRTIAFSLRGPGDADEEIYLMDVTGSNPRRLLQHPGPDTLPVWSPDGQQLIIDSLTRDKTWGGTLGGTFFRVKSDGLGLVSLGDHTLYTSAAWSPD